MKIRFIFTLMILAGLLAGCSTSAAPTQTPAQELLLAPTVTSPTEDSSFQPTFEPAQTLASTAPPMAISRGPELEATDPTTVIMATGGLQFVEFFEFW